MEWVSRRTDPGVQSGARQSGSSDMQRLTDARRRSLVNPPKSRPQGFAGYGGASRVRPAMPQG